MNPILRRIVGRFARRRAAEARAYRELVKAICGRDDSAAGFARIEQALPICDAMGKSADDLAADVAAGKADTRRIPPGGFRITQ